MVKKWWKEAIGYQIYPKSFYDSNGDGIGDLKGITSKLDYLVHLGINMIWICPFYKSPMDDNGYDVSDYFQVAKEFGTLEDCRILIQEAKKRNIRIILDLVLNQTSDEHPWFIESRKSIDNPYRDYYIWSKGKIVDGVEKEPTNWASFFGGSCWQKDDVTKEYYMKIFSKKMPDLNWENQQVQNSMVEMIKWWLNEMQIDGFRVDAIAHLAKGPIVDSTMDDESQYKPDWAMFSNLERIHDYLKYLNKEAFSKYDIVTVGEVGGGANVLDAIKYSGYQSNELNMVFNFDHNWCNNAWGRKMGEPLKIDLLRLKQTFKKWQTGLQEKAWNPIYWLNHDQPRLMTQYGDINNHSVSGKMLATALYLMWGTPFIYNGEEIGMTNIDYESIDDFNDVSTINNYHNAKDSPDFDYQKWLFQARLTSRDNARSPMQWDDSNQAGFTTGKPWIKVNKNYKQINVASQLADENSLFNYYRKVIQLRKDKYKDIIIYGNYEQILEQDLKIYAYLRKYQNQTILVVCNFFNEQAKINLEYDVDRVILSNYDNEKINLKNYTLKPYEAIVCLLK